MRPVPMAVRMGMLMGKRDRALLEVIQKVREDDTMSDTIRALIREESKRLGIQVEQSKQQPEPQA